MSARVLRDRQQAASDAVRRMAAPGQDGSEAALVQTKSAGSYPTTASAFYACTPVRIQGAEVEGASVGFVPDPSRTIFAYNLGTKAPPIGTKLIAHACGGRWTFRYDG